MANSRDELALGWRVLGCGDDFEDARSTIAYASDFLLDLWAERQREALKGFCALVDRLSREAANE